MRVSFAAPFQTRTAFHALAGGNCAIHLREASSRLVSSSQAQRRITWKLPKPAHDVHLVAIATGPGVREPFWEVPRPYQPSSKSLTPRVIGATNPIWVDADGDGRFESAFAIAQELFGRFEGDPDRMRAVLDSHDAAVRTQVQSLSAERSAQ